MVIGFNANCVEKSGQRAKNSVIQNDSIQSHEDFKAYVENYSQESGKAPITVELCVGGGDDDEIKGYRFYLTSDPNHRTRISHKLMKRLMMSNK